MVKLNNRISLLSENYLFSETARRAAIWKEKHPKGDLIRLGIGDVTLPLPAAVTQAMALAARELGDEETFRGYGPEQGYEFLREAIAREDYKFRGVELSADEIFVSDGIKTDCGAVLELFDKDNVIGVCDPVYPAYVDASVITGYTGVFSHECGKWSNLRYLPCSEQDGFIPNLPQERIDLVYLCFPNNPTGAVASAEQLKLWVDWANRTGVVLLFDGAYQAFIKSAEVPHSIYEIPGAETCAIEFRSFSKTAGFTGVRCGYTVIPKALKRNEMSLWQMWKRRLAGRTNGVSYITQRGAQAVYSAEGRRQVRECIGYYQRNAEYMKKNLKENGFTVYGGENAPYLWVKVPQGTDSWAFFQTLLDKCGVLTTPGAGFGMEGDGFLRLTSFGNYDDVKEAVERIQKLI